MQKSRDHSIHQRPSHETRQNMKILIACLILYVLRVEESSLRYDEWSEQPDRMLFEKNWPNHSIDQAAVRTKESDLNDRSTWTRNFDDSLLFVLESLTKQRKRTSSVIDDDASAISKHLDSSCHCESQHELRDLGQGHYPRYLPTSRCKKKTCRSKFYSCSLLHYVVHVLRLRETSVQTKDWYMMNDTLPEAPLPESLNRKWQLKPFLVAVACVSDSDTIRN